MQYNKTFVFFSTTKSDQNFSNKANGNPCLLPALALSFVQNVICDSWLNYCFYYFEQITAQNFFNHVWPH